MAFGRIVVPRQYPPTTPVQPAGRWLERGLLRLWVPLWRNELITGGAPSNDSTTAQRSAFGPVRGVSNVAYGAWDDDYRTLIKNKLTWFLFGEFTSTSNSFTCGNLELGGAGYNHGLYVNTSGFPLFFVKTGGSGTSAAGTSTVAGAGLALHGGTYDGANIRVFFKGRQEGSAAKTGNVDTTDFDTSLNRWFGNGNSAGAVYYFGVANQDWRPDEFAELAAAPWSILEERTIWVRVTSAGGTPQTVVVGQVSETDLAQPVTSAQARAVGQAQETDTAQPVAALQSRAVGQALETDAAQPVAVLQSRAVGQAQETDSALALAAAAQARAVGQALEGDTAQPVSAYVPGIVGQALETDTAQPVQANQALAVGQAQETDAAQPVSLAESILAGLALEIDTAFAVSALQARSVGQVLEVDTAQPVTVGSSGGVGSAADVWNYVLSNGLTAEENVVGIYTMLAQLTGGALILPVNVKQMNDATVIGDGTEANMWRGFGVPP